MSDNPTADADRLEMALERIAALASRCQKSEPRPAAPTEVAARLDALIADIKTALGQDGA
jgi:hypothetical protein